MRRIHLVLAIMTIATVLGQRAHAVDPLELINSFLEASSKEAATSSFTTDTSNEASIGDDGRLDDVLRVAQRQKSVLRLSDEKVSRGKVTESKSTSATPHSDADFNTLKVEAEKKRIESSIDRKMSALERSLAVEERRLESRFESLSKKREVALDKGDEKMLAQIEALEKRAVVEYERKVQRLLAAALPDASRAPIQQSVGSRKPPSSNSSWRPNANSPVVGSRSHQEAARGAAEAADAQPQRRLLRLWPFGR